LAFATIMWLYWICWASVIINNRDNNFSERKDCSQTTLLVVSWFTVICIVYYLQSMVRIMLR
jgi:hypothetical protein